MALMCERRVRDEEKSKKRNAVMTYYHQMSHNVKAHEKKFGGVVVVSTEFKLGNLTHFLPERKGC